MFKSQFKYYKSKCPPPDLSTVLDLRREEAREHIVTLDCLSTSKSEPRLLNELGLRDPSTWEIFKLKSNPGLIVILNPFSSSGQRQWVRRCVASYTGPPNKMNLHTHGDIDPSESWWDVCQTDPVRKKVIYKKLRWTTLGYHHDWDEKVYTESSHSKMPEEVKSLCAFLAQIIGGWYFNAEAAIVNYYHFESTLAGHTDHSEPNSSAPLFSISFGQSAIFMIGGTNIDDEAVPIVIRSGDVVIMSGTSRLCYHAVPRILPADNCSWRSSDVEDAWKEFESYLETSRINMNVRQVLFDGQTSLAN